MYYCRWLRIRLYSLLLLLCFLYCCCYCCCFDVFLHSFLFFVHFLLNSRFRFLSRILSIDFYSSFLFNKTNGCIFFSIIITVYYNFSFFYLWCTLFDDDRHCCWWGFLEIKKNNSKNSIGRIEEQSNGITTVWSSWIIKCVWSKVNSTHIISTEKCLFEFSCEWGNVMSHFKYRCHYYWCLSSYASFLTHPWIS